MLEKIDKGKQEKKEETKPKGKPAVSKDNPGRIRNRPMSHLPNEDYLQLRVNLLEIDKVRLEVNNIKSEIEKNAKSNIILQHLAGEKSSVLQKMQANHVEFIEGIDKRTGIDLRNKSIDMVTREVLADSDPG